MTKNLYSLKSQVKALTVLLENITCEITDIPDPNEGDTTSKVTGIKIGWYTVFLIGTNVTFLEDQNEDNNFTRLLPVMSASDFV